MSDLTTARGCDVTSALHRHYPKDDYGRFAGPPSPAQVTAIAQSAWSLGFRYGLHIGRNDTTRLSERHIRENGLRIELAHNPGPHPSITADDDCCDGCGEPSLLLRSANATPATWCPRCGFID